jgi:tRNA(Ile)-lysidine synthase
MCLLHGLFALGYRRLVVCHLNHQLRGKASLADEKFVVRQANQLALDIKVARADTRKFALDNKISLEAAGRELRYAFFGAIAKQTRCSILFLAHHADDQLETCLFNFLRGTGVAGLAGMRRTSTRIIDGCHMKLIRPLLDVSRLEILQFANEQKIPFREDGSNKDTRWTRNRIRHELLPFLDQKFGITYREAILRCARILAEEENWMRDSAEQFPLNAPLRYRQLLNLPIALQRRIIRRWLMEQELPDVGFVEVERIRELFIHSTAGPAKVNLPGNIHARRRAGILFLEKPVTKPARK